MSLPVATGITLWNEAGGTSFRFLNFTGCFLNVQYFHFCFPWRGPGFSGWIRSYLKKN